MKKLENGTSNLFLSVSYLNGSDDGIIFKIGYSDDGYAIPFFGEGMDNYLPSIEVSGGSSIIYYLDSLFTVGDKVISNNDGSFAFKKMIYSREENPVEMSYIGFYKELCVNEIKSIILNNPNANDVNIKQLIKKSIPSYMFNNGDEVLVRSNEGVTPGDIVIDIDEELNKYKKEVVGNSIEYEIKKIAEKYGLTIKNSSIEFE